MTKNSMITRLLLPVLIAVAIGLFSIGLSSRASTSLAPGAIYSTTDAHDRVDLARILGARESNTYGLTDAHDRARAGQAYPAANATYEMSDLSDRHTPEELRAFFGQ